METQLEQLTCENLELEIYKKSFFEQKHKNQLLSERNQELEIERKNIISVNQDLLEEFDALKHQKMADSQKLDQNKAIIDQLKQENSNLRAQIAANYQQEKDLDFIKAIENDLFEDDPYQFGIMESPASIKSSHSSPKNQQVICDSQSDDSALDMKNQSAERTANRARRISIDRKVISSPDRLITQNDQVTNQSFQVQEIGND